MANNFGIQFSNDRYATKDEVSEALDIFNVDGIWKDDILTYREQFKVETPLQNISYFPYNLFLTPRILNNEDSLLEKLAKLNEKGRTLPISSPSDYSARYKMRKLALRRISKFLEISSNEVALDNIINNEPIDIMYRPLKNYYQALRFFEEHHDLEPTEDLLATYLSLLRGEDELTSFYRTSDFVKENSAKGYRLMMNSEYYGMPFNRIEEMMSTLFKFINEPSFSLGAKVTAILYDFNYIRPFYDNNELVALFLIKHLLEKTKGGRYVNLIPLESLLSDNQQRYKMLTKETNKSLDLTYIYDFVQSTILANTQEVIDTIIKLEVKVGEVTYIKGDDKEQIEKEFGPIKEEKEYTEKTEEDEVKEALKDTHYIEKKALKKEHKEEPKRIVESLVSKESAKDERLLNREAKDLLESDPYISKKQAHFYVRHCEEGRFYTIQQFKKAENVVYETARTSMDNLAKRGYYRREQVKNKFVYTPIVGK